MRGTLRHTADNIAYTLRTIALALRDIAPFGRNVVYVGNIKENPMPYQYKRESLSDDEVDRLTNACDTFREKFVVWTLLDTGLRLSEVADLKKEVLLRKML